MTKKELKLFGDYINKELNTYIRVGMNQEDRGVITGLKDAVYLLGISVDTKKYQWADGASLFCKEIGVDFDRVHKGKPQPTSIPQPSKGA